MKLIVQSVLEEKMAGISKRCSCSSVKSFEFLIDLDETPQENNSDRSQIEKETVKECSKRDFVSKKIILES